MSAVTRAGMTSLKRIYWCSAWTAWSFVWSHCKFRSFPLQGTSNLSRSRMEAWTFWWSFPKEKRNRFLSYSTTIRLGKSSRSKEREKRYSQLSTSLRSNLRNGGCSQGRSWILNSGRMTITKQQLLSLKALRWKCKVKSRLARTTGRKHRQLGLLAPNLT